MPPTSYTFPEEDKELIWAKETGKSQYLCILICSTGRRTLLYNENMKNTEKPSIKNREY
jgi:hypothetical protein